VLRDKQTTDFYLFSLANFLSAFGGGMILGKGAGVINIHSLQNGSIMAFFIGAALGLAFIQKTPNKLYGTLTGCFSMCCAFTSLILFYIFEAYSVNNKISTTPGLFFFILLSIRFGFWFYARALRASNTAGQQQRIAWVELGYYLGMIFGLIIWKFLNINFGIATALLIDAALQFSAGCLDLNARKTSHNFQHNNVNTAQIYHEQKYESIWKWKLIIAVVLLTIGSQVVIFSLTDESNSFSAYILASFYFGASIAAFFCKKFKVQLTWNPVTNQKIGYATIKVDINGIKKEISAIVLGIISICFVMMSVILTKNTLLLIFVFLAAFFYEIFALGILDRIGIEEKMFQHQGIVIRAYGMMSICAALSLCLLSFANNSLYSLLLATGICIFSTGFILRRRNII